MLTRLPAPRSAEGDLDRASHPEIGVPVPSNNCPKTVVHRSLSLVPSDTSPLPSATFLLLENFLDNTIAAAALQGEDDVDKGDDDDGRDNGGGAMSDAGKDEHEEEEVGRNDAPDSKRRSLSIVAAVRADGWRFATEPMCRFT